VFENLSNKLQDVFSNLSNRGKLSESDVDAALREVRLALLEADVNYKVVKDFVRRVRERAVGAEVMKSLTPAQQVVKIVHEELIATLGEPARLNLSGPSPYVIMLVGLQGSGKTTTAAKLAMTLRKGGQRPLMVAADTRRPAAITQLEVLGRQIDVPVHAGAFGGDAIHMRRLQERMSLTTELVPALIVRKDEQDVRKVGQGISSTRPADASTGRYPCRQRDKLSSR